jgi:hypothetical protein
MVAAVQVLIWGIGIATIDRGAEGDECDADNSDRGDLVSLSRHKETAKWAKPPMRVQIRTADEDHKRVGCITYATFD